MTKYDLKTLTHIQRRKVIKSKNELQRKHLQLPNFNYVIIKAKPKKSARGGELRTPIFPFKSPPVIFIMGGFLCVKICKLKF